MRQEVRQRPGQSGAALQGEGEFGEIARSAQRSLARALADAQARSGLDRDTYLRWMALESMLWRANARALEELLRWLPPDGPRGQAEALALACHDSMRRATADLRRIDVIVPGPALRIDAWHAALCRPDAADPWRVLGVIALHARAIGGAVANAIEALRTAPFVAGARGGYLDSRLAAAAMPTLPDAGEAALASFLHGAWEGAVGYHLSYLPVLQPARAHSKPGNQSGQRWPRATTGETAR